MARTKKGKPGGARRSDNGVSTRPTRASARNNAPVEPAPPSSEDAKPSREQLDAEVEAGEANEEPSSGLAQPSDVKIESVSESQPLTQNPPVPEEQTYPEPDLASDTPLPAPVDLASEPQLAPQETAPEASTSASTVPHTRRLDSLSSSRGRGKAPVAAPRFAGRRAAAKREQLQKEDEQRKADEAEAIEEAARKQREAERRQAASERSRGSGRGRGRGRGGHGSGDRQHEPVASGPFSAGQVSKEIQEKNRRHSHRGSGWKGYRPPGRSDQPKSKAAQTEEGKSKPDANGDVPMHDFEDNNEYSSSEDEELKGQSRVDVEKLGVIDLTGDDDDLQFAPIRVARVPHKERNFGDKVSTAIKQEDSAAAKVDTIDGDENLKSNDKQQDRAVENTSETHGFQAVYSDSDTDSRPRIKPEPALEVDDQTTSDRPSSPETRRKGKEKIRARTLSTASAEEYDEEIEMQREEEQRRGKDLALIRDELGKTDAEGDTLMDQHRNEKIYLFQFPPILPDLEPIYVKPDPESANEVDAADVMQIDGPSNTGNPIDLTSAGNQPKLAPGAVGKMKVHASGKVTLDWGGMSLSMGLGGKADFLQNVVSTILPDQKVDSKDDDLDLIAASEDQGQVVNLGHVKEKFVLTPDWDALLG